MTSLVRRAENSDIPILADLLFSLFSQDIEFIPDRDKQVKGLEIIINSPSIGEILTIEVDDKIVGMVSLLYSVSTALGGKVAILEDMVIAKEYRKSGLGTQLLNSAIAYAQEIDCLRITLLTDHDNEVAQEFYKKSGFTKSAMIPMRLLFNNLHKE